MQTETIFRVLLPLLIFAFVAHRGYYVHKHGKESNSLKKREEGGLSKLAGLLGLAGFFSMIAYIINPDWLAWTSASFPIWMRWTGVGIAIAGFALLQWSQNTLGKNWSDTPRMTKEQVLVTSGPYHYIRHPIYSAFILILSSTFFISANWLIGLAWTGMTILEIASRIHYEESLMLEFFGEQYREYMQHTGRLSPRIF